MQQQSLAQLKERVKKLIPRLKCAFHQNQTLTNFCSCKKCLLPLCPSCIKIHTIQHMNMKTDPDYENLYDVIVSLNLQIKDFVELYEQNHRLFTQAQQKITQFKDQINTSIQNLKKSIIDEVQKYFNNFLISTQNRIFQMKYIQDLSQHKGQLKKALLILKKLDKNLSDESVSGKFVIRNLIKYQSKNTDQTLQKFDSFSKQFISKLQGNFCTFSLRQNLKPNLDMFLNQIFKISIKEISMPHNDQKDQMLNVSKKLQDFITQSKGNYKSDIKNSLSKVVSNTNGSVFCSGRNDLSQTQLNNTISYEKVAKGKQNENKQESFSQISRQIFGLDKKRSFVNHPSQRKSLNISQNFVQNQNTFLRMDCQNGYNNCKTNVSVHERRSSSKGKGLSLIQPNIRVGINNLQNDKFNVRFSLSSIQNTNLDIVSSKTSFIHRRR